MSPAESFSGSADYLIFFFPCVLFHWWWKQRTNFFFFKHLWSHQSCCPCWVQLKWVYELRWSVGLAWGTQPFSQSGAQKGLIHQHCIQFSFNRLNGELLTWHESAAKFKLFLFTYWNALKLFSYNMSIGYYKDLFVSRGNPKRSRLPNNVLSF